MAGPGAAWHAKASATRREVRKMNIHNDRRVADLATDSAASPWYRDGVGIHQEQQLPGGQPGLGAALRAQRQARGWNVPEMARQLREAAKASGDKSVPGNKALCTYIRRWERGTIGPSERYRLHYCKAFGLPPDRIGPWPGSGEPVNSSPALGATGIPAWAELAYRGMGEPGSPVGREVLMAAHEGSEHAEHAERRDIGDATLDQLRADLIRLSAESMTGEPFPLFLDMRRVRGRIYDALERRVWPRDATELYLLLGCLSDLMAVAAAGLGYLQAAEELIRAGWAYAVVIDHRPLMAHLRLQHASVAYWDDRPRQARDLAESGLTYLADGPNAAHLHVKYARAAARLGDADATRRAIAAARDARDRDHLDDIAELGGEFGLSAATQQYFAGSALADLDEAQPDAAAELEQAAVLYAAGPGPGEQHWFAGSALTAIDLAVIRLRVGALDAAAAALEPVLSLPAGQRITALSARLPRVRAELARARYRGSAPGRVLDERIEDFTRDTFAAGLRELPAG
jgi:transcriptional regulator with XRE-family HTH domain